MTIQRSGQITTGGTSQELLPSNTTRNGFWVQNTSSGDLWIMEASSATTASPSLRIPTGSLYETPHSMGATNNFNIIGATTGQTYSFREW